MTWLGRRGLGGLYVGVDLIVAVGLFTVTFLFLTHILSSSGAGLAAGNPNVVDLVDLVMKTWYAMPLAFLLSCVVKAHYGRSWNNISSQTVWCFIAILYFGFCLSYLAFDNFLTNIFDTFLTAIGQGEAIDAQSVYLAYWAVLPYVIATLLYGFGVVVQNYTPEGEYEQQNQGGMF